MALLAGVTPVFRMFDESKAREFYLEFLGFRLLFEHRFGENFPLYMGVARDGVTIHLTEHYGDCSPGSSIRIETDDVGGLSRELAARNYRYAKPGPPEVTPWGTRELKIGDPFGNRLVFHQSAK